MERARAIKKPLRNSRKRRNRSNCLPRRRLVRRRKHAKRPLPVKSRLNYSLNRKQRKQLRKRRLRRSARQKFSQSRRKKRKKRQRRKLPKLKPRERSKRKKRRRRRKLKRRRDSKKQLLKLLRIKKSNKRRRLLSSKKLLPFKRKRNKRKRNTRNLWIVPRNPWKNPKIGKKMILPPTPSEPQTIMKLRLLLRLQHNKASKLTQLSHLQTVQNLKSL